MGQEFHAAADGASLPILIDDLARAYSERLNGRDTFWEAAAFEAASRMGAGKVMKEAMLRS